MPRATLYQRFRYRFDNFMSRGGRSIFMSLTLVFVVLLTAISIVRGVTYHVSPPEQSQNERHFLRNVYVTFLEMTDPGNMNQDIESSPVVKIFAVASGLAGLVMLSSLIAFITTSLDQKMSELRKGHSKVLEEDHTLILGWNERVPEILRELVMANESEPDACAVILADRDKEWMDDYLKLNLPDRATTRIVTRSGSPSSLVNLELVSVDESRSVIVLADCNQGASDTDKHASDTHVVKTVLALTTARRPDVRLSIVAEVFEKSRREIVKRISPEEVSVIDTDEILAKMLVQTSRSVGLSVVYGEILSFDGCEMYFHHADWGLVTFGEIAFRWPDGIPMGLRHADGSLSLNPDPTCEVLPDDDVLILAEDDSTVEYLDDPIFEPLRLPLNGARRTRRAERTLILGWTSKVRQVIEEFADYVLEGSQIDLMLRRPAPEVRFEVRSLANQFDHLEVNLLDGDPLTTDGLLAVEPFRYENIIILSQGGDDQNRTDSETIVILLLLRAIFEEQPNRNIETRLITEILDSENQLLVHDTGVKDFIISNRLVSMILAQLSEDDGIGAVYDDLFEEEGSEIYLKPVELYFSELPTEVTYADMIAIAQKRNEVCLGVKIGALETDRDNNFGIKLIPEKHRTYDLSLGDCLVVLAEDET